VGEDYRVKIADMGCAKVLQAYGIERSATQFSRVGTPLYAGFFFFFFLLFLFSLLFFQVFVAF
jgi:hypothetical protein